MQLRFEEGKQLTCWLEDILSYLAQEHGYMPHTMRHRPCKCAVTGLTSDAEAERPRQLPQEHAVVSFQEHASFQEPGSSPSESGKPLAPAAEAAAAVSSP